MSENHPDFSSSIPRPALVLKRRNFGPWSKEAKLKYDSSRSVCLSNQKLKTSDDHWLNTISCRTATVPKQLGMELHRWTAIKWQQCVHFWVKLCDHCFVVFEKTSKELAVYIFSANCANSGAHRSCTENATLQVFVQQGVQLRLAVQPAWERWPRPPGQLCTLGPGLQLVN